MAARDETQPEEIHLDVRPSQGGARTVIFKKRRLGLDLRFDAKGGAVLAEDAPAKGLTKGMRLVAIDDENLRIDDDEQFQALFFKLADGPRPVRITFGEVLTKPELPSAYVVPALSLEATDVATKDVLLALGGGDAFVLRGALSRERRRSVVAVRKAEGKCARLGAPGDSVVAVGHALVVPDAEARDVRGALRRALARAGDANVTLVPGSRGDVVYTVKLPAPSHGEDPDLADDATLLRESHGKSSRRSSMADLLAEFSREVDTPSTATEAWGIVLKKDGDVLRVAAIKERGLAAQAALRTGDVVVALDGDVGPHNDVLAFASLCEKAAKKARHEHTYVALTLASDAVPRHLLQPQFHPTLPPPPRHHESPARRSVSTRPDLRLSLDLSASESKRLAQLRRLLRAGVGAQHHASDETSFKRPRPVIVREHGSFGGFVMEPARARPVVVAFSSITQVEMPFAPRPRVEDAVLAASLSVQFTTDAGSSRTLDLAFQSAAVAYMLADGLELARRQSQRPPSPRSSHIQALNDEARPRPQQRRLQRLSNLAAPLLMDGDAPQRTWWSTLRSGVVVELYYADDTYAVTTPLGDVPVSSTAFSEGQYCRCVVVRRMRAGRRKGKHWYVLRYKDGPYDCDQRRTSRKADLPKGTRFVGVPRDCCVLTYENQRLYWPLMLLLITGVQISAFVIFAKREHGSLGNINAGGPTVGPSSLYMRMTGPFPSCFDARNQLWRLWTYQLVHVGWYHLGVNCAMQLFFGASVEMVHGHIVMLMVYMFGVGMGALTCAFADVHRAVVGASGGVYTLIGLHAADVLLNFRSMADRSRRLVRALICTAVPALDILVYLLVYTNDDTSYASHGGGLVAGFLLGLVVLRPVDESRCHYYVVRPLALLLLVCYVLFALFWHQTVYPPEYLYNGPFWKRSSWGAPDDQPHCCWRLDGCSAIASDDYKLFNCDDDRHLSISLAWDDAAFDEELTTCDSLKAALDVALDIKANFDDV